MLITDKYKCCGCRACEEICPKQCITMKADEESFFYPEVKQDLCVHCGLCEKVCPMQGADYLDIRTAVAGVHKDELVVKASSSGGAFSAIAEFLCHEGYTVFGTTYDNNFQVAVEKASSYEECAKFRKSKYVQSNTNGCFHRAKTILKEGGKVLFSGTPCQVAAMKNYIGDKDASIFYVDIICHGVAPQACFDAEIAWLSRKYQGKVKSYTFKNKERILGQYNSRSAAVTIEGKNNELYFDYNNDPYLRGYYTRLFYRPSCAQCPFAQPKRVSDITLGDAWGIEKLYPEMNSLKGVSLIMANTEKGQDILNKITKNMYCVSVDKEWALANNQQLRHPTSINKNRDKFFKRYKSENFGKLVFTLTKKNILQRMLDILRKVRNYIRFYIEER